MDLEEANGQPPVAAPGPVVLRRPLRAKDRMDAASHEAWPVTRLARVSGISPAHFARSFKAAFGMPPHRYLRTRRLERARSLLSQTDIPVLQIALETGWNSLGSFGRAFRDVLDASPSELRAGERAAAHRLRQVPGCFVSAARRPHLNKAVSEKRRRRRAAMQGA